MKGKVALCSHSFHSAASIFTFNKTVKREGPLCQVVFGLQAKKCRWYEPMLALSCWPVDSWLIVTIRRKTSKLISVMRSQHLLHISNCLNTTSTHIYIVLYRCMYDDVTCRCCKCLRMIDYIVLRVLVAGDFISLVSTFWLLIPNKRKGKDFSIKLKTF